MFIEIIIGFVAAAFLVFIFQKFNPKVVFSIWSNALVVAALIYVGFALFGKNWEWLPIEIGGVFIYSIFVWLGKKYSILFLALGWGLHVLWDLILHPNGHPGFVPEWYPGVCLGFDLLVAGYLVWYFFYRKKRNLGNPTL